MKTQQYREMSHDELSEKLEQSQRQLFELHSQAVTEKLENSRAVRNLKRDIARIKTVIRETEIQQSMSQNR